MSSPRTGCWRAVPLGLVALWLLGACSTSTSSSSEPSITSSSIVESASALAATSAKAVPGPLRIDIVLDDGAESIPAVIQIDAAARAEQAGLALPEAPSWCSGEAFVPGQVFVVKIDRSDEPVDAELQWVEVESSEPVDGAGTYPAEAFVLLAGDTALHLEAAELTVADDLVHGTFSGTSESGVRVDGTFSCG